jgi:hypothetical protein
MCRSGGSNVSVARWRRYIGLRDRLLEADQAEKAGVVIASAAKQSRRGVEPAMEIALSRRSSQ